LDFASAFYGIGSHSNRFENRKRRFSTTHPLAEQQHLVPRFVPFLVAHLIAHT
jgi:hypothetical protein